MLAIRGLKDDAHWGGAHPAVIMPLTAAQGKSDQKKIRGYPLVPAALFFFITETPTFSIMQK